jgi:hypothetical protein
MFNLFFLFSWGYVPHFDTTCLIVWGIDGESVLAQFVFSSSSPSWPALIGRADACVRAAFFFPFFFSCSLRSCWGVRNLDDGDDALRRYHLTYFRLGSEGVYELNLHFELPDSLSFFSRFFQLSWERGASRCAFIPPANLRATCYYFGVNTSELRTELRTAINTL